MSRNGVRGQELSGYAALSFGVALAVYSKIINEHVWPTGASVILMAIGIGSLFGGMQMLRSLPSDRVQPSFALRALAAVAPLAVAVAMMFTLAPTLESRIEQLALRDRDIEDVTIALPRGDESPNPQRAATLTISRVGGLDLFAAVLWQIGTFDDDNARAIAEAGAQNAGAGAPETLPDTALPVGTGIPHRSFHVTANSVDIFVTVFACGPRIYSVILGGGGAPELSRRILASVRCHAGAETGRTVPAIVELPDGWKLSSSEPGQLAYVLGDEMLGVTVMDIVADDALQGMMESTVRHLGAGARLGERRDVNTQSGRRPVWSGTITEGGVTVPLQLSAWSCPGRRVMLAVQHVGGRDDASTVDLIGRVRCAPAEASRPAGSGAR